MLNKIIKNKRRKNKKIFVACDVSKAYDSITVEQINTMLQARAVTQADKHLASIISNLCVDRKIHIGSNKVKVKKGVA
jgi:hypothetical protein